MAVFKTTAIDHSAIPPHRIADFRLQISDCYLLIRSFPSMYGRSAVGIVTLPSFS